MTATALSMLAAVLLDRWLGEPRRWHPLVGFGRLAARVERALYGTGQGGSRRLRGALAVAVLLLPPVAAAVPLTTLPAAGPVIGVLLLWFALGHRSLGDHARPVAQALRAGDGSGARRLAARLVSRDPETLDIPAATTESVLENGCDAVFGALFWFAVAGGAGALFYRLANTLDASWGYRSERYRDFGWAAAHLDDLLNLIPARLTALTYALLGHTRQALACWRSQAPAWDSPNAGPVMAAGAGALGLRLGGPARYRGQWHRRPPLGAGASPTADDIGRALELVRRGVWLWLVVVTAIAAILHA